MKGGCFFLCLLASDNADYAASVIDLGFSLGMKKNWHFASSVLSF
jgi:hypothetical protein